jgi:hypothetical protein
MGIRLIRDRPRPRPEGDVINRVAEDERYERVSRQAELTGVPASQRRKRHLGLRIRMQQLIEGWVSPP